MNTKLNVQELFFQLKNKKQGRIKSFDSGLFTLGIHQELKTALVPVKCDEKNGLKIRG